jgi:hypothetical protein
MKSLEVAIVMKDIPEEGIRKGDRVVLLDKYGDTWVVERPHDRLPHDVADVPETDLAPVPA